MLLNEEYLYKEITYKIIGCSMEVHKTLGNGFQEVIYQRALALEFKDKMIKFQREVEMPIYYKNENIGSRRVDFLVEDNIMVELKAITELGDAHLSQALNYLEAYKLDIGLLINFGSTSLQYKRVINEKKLNRK
ncbi:MAG: GxxExxY protein [Ignavibacteriaceae bacterium]